MNSINVTKSWIARMKKLITTTSHARNITTMGSMLANTSGKPVNLPICFRIGVPASIPTFASLPGWRNSACVMVEPDATSPNPAKDRNTIPASMLKLPMM
ncbi:hypothetical protein D3C79_1025590 [compost metagenome]